MTAYSDRINHALAFAAKHRDRQVHRGSRSPYRTHAAMMAVILTRFDQPDAVVIAGILHDFVEDMQQERQPIANMQQRLVPKFGAEPLEIALSVAPRATDDRGLELSHDERRDDLLTRLEAAQDTGRWVCAASTLFESASLLAALRRTIDPSSVWNGQLLGREEALRWYRRLYSRLLMLGFTAAIMSELDATVAELESQASDPSHVAIR